MRAAFSFAMILAAVRVAAAAELPPLSIGELLAQGWEIAGYASGYDNRTSLILFRHAGTNPGPVRGPLRRHAQSTHDRQLLRAALIGPKNFIGHPGGRRRSPGNPAGTHSLPGRACCPDIPLRAQKCNSQETWK